MDNFGHNFRLTIFGESHGEAIGVVVDGVKAGIKLTESDFSADLARRAAGGPGTTPRKEADAPHIISGVYNGYTTGGAITVIFVNENTRSKDYAQFKTHPRPSHADLVAQKKYEGYNDPRGGGHFSGRLTLGLVAAGVIAKKMLDGVTFNTEIAKIGCSENRNEFDDIIQKAQQAGDSVGGVVECVVTGVQAGLGDPFFDSVESVASHLLFSIPAVKGVEFGAGFKVADRHGSDNNDMIADENGTTVTNNDGGINGGITNGNPIIVRVAVKPTPSISMDQSTFDFEVGAKRNLRVEGRHDACIALRAAVVVEAAMAIALAEVAAK